MGYNLAKRKMKKLFIALFILCSFSAFSQNAIIINQTTTNNEVSGTTSNSNIFYINGVPSSSDIGGVEVSTSGNPDPYGNPYIYHVYFKNYRDYPVTVLYEFTVGPSRDESIRTGSIIVPANDTKSDGNWYKLPKNFRIIVRKL